MNRIHKALLCLALIASAPSCLVHNLYAQSTTEGAVAATVADISGALVSGASVTLRNTATDAEVTLTTDNSGYFKSPQLAPGIYTVSIKASGYGEYKATGVAVTVGSLTELHPSLQAGSAVESVEVSGDAPVLEFESPEISETITAKEIVNLPLNGGRWSDLALLTPAATSDGNGFGLIVFRGISPLLNNVQIDGADDNQAFFSEERGRTREGYSTSQIGIAEFQVNTGVYSAEYGRAVGGVINSITKSGANALHGQAYFLDRDNDWGTFNPFTTFTSVTEPPGGGAPHIVTGVPFKPKDWRKRWGFGAGGSLIKDKLFWFYAYDQYRRNFPGVAKPASPSAFFNQFADLALPSGAACTASSTKAAFTGTGSAGDTSACALAWRVYNGNYAAAAAHFDQLLFGKAVSSLTGLNTPGLLDDLGTTPRTGDEVLNTPKLDWQINEKEHASFLYHRLRWDSPGGVQTQTSNNYAIDTFGTDFVKLDYGMAKLDSFITNNFSNELRFQYGRELNDEGQQPHSAFTNTYLTGSSGIPVQLMIQGGTANNGFTAGMPYYSFRYAYPAETKDQVGDTANLTWRNHSIKFGFDLLRNTDLINNLYESNGVYTYTYFSDFFADILKPSGSCDTSESQMGIGTNTCYFGFTEGLGTQKFQITTLDYGAFVQDDWKFNPRLTFNIGLRYDYEHVPPPFPSLISSSLLTTAVNGIGPFPDSRAGIGNQPSDTTAFGPRVGLSWDPVGNGKTVIRTGYGMYYGRNLNGIVLNTYEASGSPKGQYTIPTIFGTAPSATAPAFPQIIANNGTYATPSLDFYSSNFGNPYVHEIDVSLQREVLPGTYLSLDALGAYARKLPNFLNINLNPSTMKSTTLTITDSTGSASGTVCGPLACGTAIPTAYYVKPYVDSHYGSITEVASNINSSYNGLAIDFQNRGNKYAQFDANFTFSHALDFNQNESTSPSSNNWWDPNGNPRANYGNSSFNVPKRFVGWAMLSYPVVASGWKRYLENGWHLNPVIQIQNGLPYSASVSGAITGAAGSGINGSGTSNWLLQTHRNSVRQPMTFVFDARVQKDVHLTERMNLELVAEGFNLPNYVNVTGVNSTAYSISGSNLKFNPLVKGTGLTTQSGFGAITNADSNFVYSQRQIQLGMKLDF